MTEGYSRFNEKTFGWLLGFLNPLTRMKVDETCSIEIENDITRRRARLQIYQWLNDRGVKPYYKVQRAGKTLVVTRLDPDAKPEYKVTAGSTAEKEAEKFYGSKDTKVDSIFSGSMKFIKDKEQMLAYIRKQVEEQGLKQPQIEELQRLLTEFWGEEII